MAIYMLGLFLATFVWFVSNLRYRKRGLYCAFRSYGKVTSGFVSDLVGILGTENVSTRPSDLETHSHDESYHRNGLPGVVVKPRTPELTAEVVKLCSTNTIPVIPFGTATGLEGGVTAPYGGVCIDLNDLTEISSVNAEDFNCTVQAGVSRLTLNDYLRDTGLHFPIDPGADASVCGMAATNASGTAAVYYGTMRENVLNAQIVTPSGNLIYTRGQGRATKKSSAGYNLTNLYVGSEGTLGIITAVTLKLRPLPESAIAAAVFYPDIAGAVQSVVEVMCSGITPARIELMDDVQVHASNLYSKLNHPVTPLLLFEFLQFPGTTIEPQVELVAQICKPNGGSDFQWAKDETERKRLWKARHDIYYANLGLAPGKKAYTTDVCVPISRLPEVVVAAKEDIQREKLLGPIVGHVGDGNFHCMFLLNDQDLEEVQAVKECSHRIVNHALAVGGTCTGEHGVGLGKRQYLEQELGSGTLDLMKGIKAAFDPQSIMNPGKVLP